jgi:transposase-like protein
MKHIDSNSVSYTKSYKQYIIYAVMRNGDSIAKVCHWNNISDENMVRTWVREFMKKRGMTRIPRTMKTKRGEPKVCIPERINHEFSRLEETILYLQTVVESMFSVVDEESKKKLLEKLSPSLRKRLKKEGKL